MEPFASNSQRATEQNSSAVWGPVATLLWTVLIAIVFILTQLITAGFYLALTMPGQPLAEVKAALHALTFDGRFLSLSTFATALFCAPLIVGIVKLKRGSKLKEYLGLIVPGPRQLWRWSIVAIAYCVLADVISSLLGESITPEFMLKAYSSANPRWLLWLALTVAAPVFEELCFRGFILRGLAASRLHWYGATIVSSVLWAAIHVQYNWYGVSAVFALGLVFGTARARTNSILLTMWLHCLVNVIATVETAITLRHL